MAKRQNHSLDGRVAAVTGGGRGIGRSIAAALVARGMHVAVGDRDFAAAEEAAANAGARAKPYALDVCDARSFAGFLDTAERDLGPLYALCNNAGIMLTGAYENENMARTQAMIDVNVYGVATGCRIALPRMLARRAGHIINLGSMASKAGYPGIATYCATKFYVLGLSEALRAELRGSGVHISCVMPGFVDTELTSGVRDTWKLRRIAPSDVANAVVRAIERPRFEIFAPSSIGHMNAMLGLVPRSLREALIRWLGADRILASASPSERLAYIHRASVSGRSANRETINAESTPAGLEQPRNGKR